MPVADANGPAPGPRARRASRPRLRLGAMCAALAAAFAALVALLYAMSVHTGAGDSDKATTILVGQAIGDGHLLVHGWILSPGNYWTTDATFYALLVRLFGLRPGLLYAEPAAVAAVTIAVGVVIALEGRRGSLGLAGAVTVVALLGLVTPLMAFWFLGKGFHVATALYVLVSFWALRRGRFGWGWALGVTLIAFGMLGDLMIVAYGSAPLLIAGLVAMLRERRWQAGLAPLSAGIASAGIGEGVLLVTEALGRFKTGSPLRLAALGRMPANLGHLFVYGADLAGLTNGRLATDEVPLALLEVHAVGALLTVGCLSAALVSLVKGAVRGPRRDGALAPGPELWRLDDMLLAATAGSAAIFVILAGPNGRGVHFLVVPLVFAGVVAGRMVARAWPKVPARWAVRTLASAGLAVSLSLGAGVGYALSRPAPAQPAGVLATWLEAHDLRNGIGGYWSASITTVESSGAVSVRPVSIGANGFERTMSQSTASWYAGQRFQFFVYGTTKFPNDYLALAIMTWGAPEHVYHVGRYRVLVWDHLLTVAVAK